MKKNFVLDTNVLLHDPRSIHNFADNNVIIPIYAIEEIDTFKKDLSELGRNARLVARILDEFREQGKLSEGVGLPGGGMLRIIVSANAGSIPASGKNKHLVDNKILGVALEVMKASQDSPTIFVTQDTNLRIRADALGLTAVNYRPDSKNIEELYSGFSELAASPSDIDAFYENGAVPLPENVEFFPNQFIVLRNGPTGQHSALGRVDIEAHKVRSLIKIPKEGVWGIKPRNKEQSFALELLMDDGVQLVTLVGMAGTGKTLLALAVGLHKVADENRYVKLLVSRPIFPLGRDIGYLPGEVEEKLNPWMKPIFDNVEYIMGITKADRRRTRGYKELEDMGLMEIEPLTYIRGRSLPKQFIVVDEAQNLTPHEVKTIITRAGEGTKIVLTGDPYQIDNPYVDSSNNGLVHIVNRFAPEAIAGHVTLTKGERSHLAELAANRL
ncbi:MAG: PhoH family protein [Deltaproteobacteria bacterium]|nr:PhoH family protein [Deltaproteobacteria bacterium]